MVFSSISFLYVFLPMVLILYFIVPNKFKNLILLISSLIFYFYGEPKYIVVLLFSCIFNYYYGKAIEKSSKNKKLLLIINLVINFGILFYFKYFNFFLDNINLVFSTNLRFFNVIMPIGISFFTFQATSYVIDIYRGEIKSADNVFTFATYLALFPQLIAGPIVRYETIEEELKTRKHNFSYFASGVKRFIIGIAKKVLIANVLGEFSKSLVGLTSKTVLSYWLNAISNAMQIYFDFSGYSDMAIGLGLMFGFHFLENFNYPFIAKSITDFWRRWHISLSTWFKDYVYIPLGGNKKGKRRHYINILIVWMLTGFWHGASWNFILWGLYFAILLMIEKAFLLKRLEKHKMVAHLYTIILVIISFIIFNETTTSDILLHIKGMLGLENIKLVNIETLYYLKNYALTIIFASLAATPLIKNIGNNLNKHPKIRLIGQFLEPIIYIVLLLIVTSYIVDESFNPFLYFRF